MCKLENKNMTIQQIWIKISLTKQQLNKTATWRHEEVLKIKQIFCQQKHLAEGTIEEEKSKQYPLFNPFVSSHLSWLFLQEI